MATVTSTYGGQWQKLKTNLTNSCYSLELLKKSSIEPRPIASMSGAADLKTPK